jgi:acyl-homoserine-lactone acylase
MKDNELFDISHVVKFLSPYIKVNDEEQTELSKIVSYKYFKKNEIIHKEGALSRHIALIAKGAIRLFYTDEDGQNHSLEFVFENSAIGEFNNFINPNPASGSAQALENCYLIAMSRFIFSVFLFLFISTSLFAQVNIHINVDNIDIIRDEYGVPHIFTKTDAEAIYGIAWAQCEDNFNMIQVNFAATKNKAGRLRRKNGAVLDFIYQSFEIAAYVDRRYEQDISPEMDNLLKIYAAAINKYAATHPKEVELKHFFPVAPKQILGSYTLNFLLTHSSIMELGKLLSKKYDYGELDDAGRGSNAMAFNKNKTTDGKTYLIGNPHQPINEFANFWEVSVHSEEGYEFYGVTFSGGGVFPVIGSNRHLGWTHTTNYQNCSDVYELEMHPNKKNHYKYDGEWLPLEQKKAKLKVKIGFMTIPVGKKYYWSKYGPTFKKKDKYYSYKSNSFINLKAAEQWYKMGLATNIEEFKTALEIQGIPLQTITYADKDNNIWHISPNNHPMRDESYDWSKVLKGNTSANNWDTKNIYPVDKMIQLKNPNCGYLYDCNNTPLKMTASDENPKLEDYPKSFGIPTSNTIRANSFENMINNYDIPFLVYLKMNLIGFHSPIHLLH